MLANCQSEIGEEDEILKEKRRSIEKGGEHVSLHPQPIPAIPEETAHLAHAVLPQGNVYMQMRDELEAVRKGFQGRVPLMS